MLYRALLGRAKWDDPGVRDTDLKALIDMMLGSVACYPQSMPEGAPGRKYVGGSARHNGVSMRRGIVQYKKQAHIEGAERKSRFARLYAPVELKYERCRRLLRCVASPPGRRAGHRGDARTRRGCARPALDG